MFTRVRVTFAAALLCGVTIAACGGGDTPASDGGEASAPADAAAPAAAATEGGATLALGESQYQQVCVACHMVDGNGLAGAFPSLVGSAWATTSEAKVPISIVLHGLQGPIEVNGQSYNGVMAAWASLSDEDIAAVLTYVRSSWGNSASAVTAAQVKEVRDAEGSRGAWTADELKGKYPAM